MLSFMTFALFTCLYVAQWAIARWTKDIMEECEDATAIFRMQVDDPIPQQLLDRMHDALKAYPDPRSPVWEGPQESQESYESWLRAQQFHIQ